MDGPENKVSVPGHFGPHPPEYHGYVAKSLKDAVSGKAPYTQDYANAVKSTLNKIAIEATTVNSKVNKWLTTKK